MSEDKHPAEQERLERERDEILVRLQAWLEWPMLVLAFVWLALLVLEFTYGLSPFLGGLVIVIWVIFILDFILKIVIAPLKLHFIRRNWLTVIALIVPALRVFRVLHAVRILRVTRAVRGLRLIRVVSTINRGMKALGNSLSRRGFGYVIAITLIVIFAGAAGMYAFESQGGEGIRNYGEALWWTAMVITSLGSDYWPVTPEGRLLCLLLAIYGFIVFGYITATLATFFIGQDADNDEAELAGERSMRALKDEIAGLRAEIAALRNTRSQ